MAADSLSATHRLSRRRSSTSKPLHYLYTQTTFRTSPFGTEFKIPEAFSPSGIMFLYVKSSDHNHNTYTGVLCLLLREPLLKKIFPHFFQDCLFHFFYNRAPKTTHPSVQTTEGLCYRKNQLKVFGKGYGGDSPQCGEMSAGQRGAPPSEEPFLRKVSPIINYKLLYKYCGYGRSFYLIRPMPQIVKLPLPVIETSRSPVVS